MSQPVRVLYVDDNAFDRELVRHALERESAGFKLTEATSRADFEARLNDDLDVVLSDFNILGYDGLMVIDAVRARCPDVPVIIVTGTGSEEIAVEALKRGAADYVIKTAAHVRRLPGTIRSALESKRMAEERAAAIEALRERERLLQGVFNAIQHGVQCLDRNLTVLHHNPTLEKWIGRPFVGEKCYKAIWGRDAPCERCTAVEAMGTKSLRSRVVRPVFADGQERDVHVFSYPMLDEQSEVIGVVEYALDVTEQKHAERALERSRRRLQRVVQASNDGIWEWPDLSKDEYWWSPRFYEMLGYEEGEFTPTLDRFVDLLHPDDRERVAAEIQQKTEQQGPFETEYRLRAKSGNDVWVQARGQTFRDETGRPVSMAGSVRDLTERREAQKALAESEERFRALFEHMPSGVAVYEAVDDGRDFVFTDFNSEAELIEERPREDVLGKRVTEAFPGVEESGILEILRRVSETGQTERIPEVFYRDEHVDGTWRECWVFRLPAGQVVAVYNDITDRKRAEEELQASERKFRILAETVQDVFWMSSPGVGESFYVSPAYESIWGRSCEEVAQNPMAYFDLIHPGDRERCLAVVKESHAKSRAYQAEYRIIRPDGEERWILERGFPVSDGPAGEPVMAGVCTDVTARKEAEEDLVRQSVFLEELIESIPNPVFYKGVDGRYLGCNRAFCGYLGKTKDQIVGKTVYDVAPEELARTYAEKDQAVFDSGGVQVYEESVERAGGAIRDVVFHKAAFSLPDGSIGGLIAVIVDVTERKRMEKELRESETRYRGIVEDQTEYVARYLPDGTFTFVNGAICRALGRSREELIGKTFAPYVHPDDLQAVLERLASLTPESPLVTAENRNVLPTGEVRVGEWTNRGIFDDRGKLVEIQAVCRDVTDRKKAEEMLRESEARFRELFNNMKSGVAVYRAVDNGEDFVFQDINPSGARIGRTSRDEHLGHSVQEIYPGVQELGLLDVFREVWRTGKPRRHPVSLYQDDRVSHWVENYVYKLPSGEIVAVYDDVTEQKQAQDALAEARRRLELALRSSNVGLWDWDFASGDVYFSPEWKSQIGYRDDEIEARYEEWEGRLHPDDAERTLQALRAYAEGTTPGYSVEFRFRHKDGSYRWIWAQGEALHDREGKPARMLGCHVDITERRQAEEALRASRERFKTLADTLPQTIYECDADGRLTYVNRQAFRTFGYTAEDIEKGLYAMEMLASDERPRGRQAFSEALAGKIEPAGREYVARRKDGSTFPIVIYSSPILREGLPGGLRGIIVDLTERKRAEEAVVNMARFPKENPDPVMRVAGNGAIVFANAAARRLLGSVASSYNLLPAPWSQMAADSCGAGRRRSEVEIDAGGSVFSFTIVPIPGMGYSNWYGHDVTDRKRAEAALAQSEKELRTVFDHAPVMMLLLDEDRRLRRANQAATHASGKKRHDEIVGLRVGEVLDCVHALDQPRGFGPACQTCGVRNMVLDTLQTGRNHCREEHSLRVEREGQQAAIHMRGSTVRLTLEDRPHVLLSIQDVTQQKQAEEELREREAQLAHFNRLHTVGEMAGALAHELNQPLYAINNYVRGAQRRLARQLLSPDLETLVEAMERVSKEVERAAGIISHLRGFVRGREARRSSVDLGELLNQAADLLRPAAREKGVVLELEIDKDLPVVQADPIQVEQVVVNLVANAVDAAAGLPQERRKVTIIGRAAEKGWVEVAVRDLGPGVPEDITERLFEAFVTTKDEGLGMGLALSRSIVNAHGGKIWAVHNQPQGATFHFTLPASAPSEGRRAGP